jgi:hypothetical protein
MSYAATRSSADRLIASKGQAITLTRQASQTYDPATGSATITTSTQSGRGVILPLNLQSSAFQKLQGNVVAGDQQLLLSALTSSGTVLTAPHVDDTATDANSNVWSIVSVDPLSPGGTDLIYDCVIRRAA